MSKWQEFKQGVSAAAPLLLGILPFGMAYGILGREVGLSIWQTFFMSSLLYAGTSQIIFAQLVGISAPAPILLGSIAAMNARHLLYSASISSYLRHLSLRWRLILAYFLTDETFAVTIARYQSQEKTPHMHFFMLGAGITLWSCWQCATAIGIIAGASLPQSLQLGFVIPLIFMVIIIPLIKGRHELIVIFTAAVIVLNFQDLPYNSWLILASIGGVISGSLSFLYEKRQKG